MVKPGQIQPSSIVTSASSTPGPSKRRKVEEDETNGLSLKKQRTRVSFSCGECHRRKQKCDRQVPCSHCVARKVPELCKAYTPGKTDQDINARIARLEHIVEAALPQYCSPSSPHSASFDSFQRPKHKRSESSGDDDDMGSSNEEQDPSNGTFQAGNWYGASASGSVAPGTVLEQLENVVSPALNKDIAHRERTHSRQASTNDPSSVGQSLPREVGSSAASLDSEPTAADRLGSLIRECGVSAQLLPDLLQELPPHTFGEMLVKYYFDAVNWTRYPISERDFRTAYSSIATNGVVADPNHVRFLPLLFVVLAIAVRLVPDRIGGDAHSRRLLSLRFYWSSRRSLLIAAAIQPDSLEAVLTRLLSARFLTFDRRITECWSQLGAAVRTAQALGLHRDGATMRMDPAQVEYRRRIWAYLYHADRSYALVLGRPNAIQDDYTSTLPPSNIDDEPSGNVKEPPPLSYPTPMTFVILRHHLASIIGRMVHHFQQVRTPSHYPDVITLDDDLLKFVQNLPPHFALEPDTSMDMTLPYIPVHRFLLITEILFVRISLHRPYILRRLESDRYLRSRTACFESAIKDFHVRQAFRQSVPQETRNSLGNAYREFQAAMISGIYLVLEPNGKEASTMHAILDAFVADHRGMTDMDDTTRRELKTIEFIKKRSSQMEGRAAGLRLTQIREAAVSSGDTHLPEAQLLLSLHQTSRQPDPKSPTRLTVPPLGLNLNSPRLSPPMPFATPTQPSLFLHRRQRSANGGDGLISSPAASNSPSAEDESMAQSLLNQWFDNHSYGPTLDNFPGINSAWGGPGGNDPSLMPSTQSLPDPNFFPCPEGAEYNYWEALVNQISAQGGPVLQ